MNLSAIKKDTHFLAGSTSATYWDIDLTRNLNIALAETATKIWESDGGWAFDSTTNTDSPVAYKTMGNLSAVYTIPTTALRIKQVEVKDQLGDWHKLSPITYEQIVGSPEEYNSAGGMPTEYALEGNEIRLFPPPVSGNVTLTSGIAVRLSREVTPFAVSATSTIPGFATPYHRLLSVAAALDFTRDDANRKYLQGLQARLQNGLVKFYSKRAEEFPTVINPAGRRFRRQYE